MGPQLTRDLRVRMERAPGIEQLPGVKLLQGCRLLRIADPRRKLSGLLVALDERTLDFLLLGHARERREIQQNHCQMLHSTSAARTSRTVRAKSSTARASATRSSTVRITV
jgi:hypothetical protein